MRFPRFQFWEAVGIIGAMDNEALMKDWSFRRGGQPIMTLPRIGVFRTILLNHLYHHRVVVLV